MILIDPEGRRLAGLPPGQWDLGDPSPQPGPGTANRGTVTLRSLAELDDTGDCGRLARAVRDLGFVEIAGVRDGVHVRMRPLLVSGPAITQVFFALADMRPPRVVLVRFDDDRQQWRHEICGHWRNALDRVNALVLGNERVPSYVATELDLAEIDGSPADGLIELRLLWERSSRRLENGSQEAFDRLDLHRQSILVAAARGGDSLTILQHGPGVQFYGQDWSGSAAGRDFTDQPDGVFAARTGANLRRSIALDRPLFHRVEATVRRNPRSAVQVSYRRLVLPWQMPDGRRAASSTVLLDQFIEIAR